MIFHYSTCQSKNSPPLPFMYIPSVLWECQLTLTLPDNKAFMYYNIAPLPVFYFTKNLSLWGDDFLQLIQF